MPMTRARAHRRMRLPSVFVATAMALVVLAGIAAAEIPRGPLLHHHSIAAPYISDWWQEGIPHWELGGDTVATDAYIRLTPQRQSRVGWLWNVQPNDNPQWELRMRFAVYGKRAPGADGMALWYVAEMSRDSTGSLFGAKSTFRGFGIVFDTYDNDNLRDNPAISLIADLDGSKTKWNTDEDLRQDAVLRCNFDFRHSTHEDPVEAIVQYFEKKLSLRLRILRRGIDVMCGEVFLELPIGYYWGVTASTGGMVDNHDVLSIETRALGEDAVDHSTPIEHFDDEADKRDRSFWSAQVRSNGRQR